MDKKRRQPGRPFVFNIEIFSVISVRSAPKSSLDSSHPETPSPLAGEGWGEGGIEMKSLDIPIMITPTLTLPPQKGEGKKRYSRVENGWPFHGLWCPEGT